MVLTLDRRKWKDRYEAFKDLSLRWRALRKAITREWGANDWVGTVEVHRSGWPHINVVMVCPGFADEVTDRIAYAKAWLKRRAVACGFGYMLSLERAANRRALAGYVVKVAGNIEQRAQPDAGGHLVGEIVKLSQLPENAPSHFRRLRSSIRFLPPPFKSEGVTGRLIQEPLSQRSAADGNENSDRRRDPIPPSVPAPGGNVARSGSVEAGD